MVIKKKSNYYRGSLSVCATLRHLLPDDFTLMGYVTLCVTALYLTIIRLDVSLRFSCLHPFLFYFLSGFQFL